MFGLEPSKQPRTGVSNRSKLRLSKLTSVCCVPEPSLSQIEELPNTDEYAGSRQNPALCRMRLLSCRVWEIYDPCWKCIVIRGEYSQAIYMMVESDRLSKPASIIII